MKLKLSENEVSQTIDLEKTLGSAGEIPAITEAFSQAVLDHIRERTESGRDLNGKLFSPYSKSYKESLAFSVFGKSNQPNMTLTGDMLSTMFADESNGKLKISFDGVDNNIKAFAHQTGFKNHPVLEGKVKPREFFGITDKELQKIAKEFKPDLSREANRNDNVILNKLKKAFGF